MTCDVSKTAVLDYLLVNTQLDPLSTLYYMAPASALLIGTGLAVIVHDCGADLTLFCSVYRFVLFEASKMDMDRFTGEFSAVLLLNAMCAFVLNVRRCHVFSHFVSSQFNIVESGVCDIAAGQYKSGDSQCRRRYEGHRSGMLLRGYFWFGIVF
jgi:hypothetical protein